MMQVTPSSTNWRTAKKPAIGYSVESIVGGSNKELSQLTTKNQKETSPKASFLEHQVEHCLPNRLFATTLIKSLHFRDVLNSLAHSQLSSGQNVPVKNGTINFSNVSLPIPNPSQPRPLSHGSNNSSASSSSEMASPTNQNSNISNVISSSKNVSYKHPLVIIDSITSSSLSSPSPVITSDSNNVEETDFHTSPEISPNDDAPTLIPTSNASRLPTQLYPPQSFFLPADPSKTSQFARFPPTENVNFAPTQTHLSLNLPGWISGGLSSSYPTIAHPFYPWLLARQSHLFSHRFGPDADLHGFLLHPLRKPKRIRTAFSPSQLLKLEHAFERNHYVVGTERKQLANSLSLSETQIKIWFQNRRTKQKRVQFEEETLRIGSSIATTGEGHSSPVIIADSLTKSGNSAAIIINNEDEDDEEQVIMNNGHNESSNFG